MKRQVNALACAAVFLGTLLCFLWPTDYLFEFDANSYTVIAGQLSPAAGRPIGLLATETGPLCWLGATVFDNRFTPQLHLTAPVMQRVVNEQKGWWMELPLARPCTTGAGSLLVAHQERGSLLLTEKNTELARWHHEYLGTSHPLVELLPWGPRRFLAVFPHRVLQLDSSADGRPAGTIDEAPSLFNWSADLLDDTLALGRSGALLLISLHTKENERISIPSEQYASWARVGAVCFLTTKTLALTIEDPRPELCRLHFVTKTNGQWHWSDGRRLPYTDDGTVFVHPAALTRGPAGTVFLFTAQKLVGEGSALLLRAQAPSEDGLR